jgi:cytochrome c-type biogenesis protein CcsB
MSPSSFASEIELIDQENQLVMPYRIFMNNILDYRGYRFYQSSYDQDEKGTILSVNHDKAGTMVTYLGYFLLFGTMLASLLTRKTRFARLNRQINEIHTQRKKLAVSILLLLIPALVFGQNMREIDQQHAAKFGKLLVQSKDGRIIPLNTIASNSLVKIYKKSSFEGHSAEQVLLGIMTQPDQWKNVSIIKIYDEAVSELLGVSGKYAAFNDFFDDRGGYKLGELVDEIYAKSPAKRSQFDKEIMAVDERINVLYMLFRGSLLKIFPVPDHPNNKWTSPDDFRSSDSSAVVMDYFNYLTSIPQALNSGNYKQADFYLETLKDYQHRYGKEVIPSDSKVNLEVFYNNANIFKKLFPIFMTLGLVLLGIFLIQLFRPALEFRKVVNVFYVLLFIAFIVQTFGLGLRWYISGHAPWSNGYESMIYIAWAMVLAGFIFLKKSPMTLSATAILAGITLLTAHMSWLNPEITNLVPVLKSYWLTFHVATITASYGFFALGSIMGFINLGIMIFRTKENHERINLSLKELTLTIEMSLMVGLILLVIVNFLGGIWANESWGRYWGWDPKETWSLVTIIVYSFILHMRLIPGLRTMFSTNFLALIGFGSVLMTYFGVNYYLSGLHSYAQGDPIPVPTFVYYLVAAIALISILAMINEISLRNKVAMTSDVIPDEEDE